ncbi:lipoyl synthase [Desulfovibrio ferrophilus]|uniref:Lipoyl synthase n=1 Tax=Desulfovibrio ferrophilus TaxID=241368 RepID=A0A2Z6AVA0_9BACT|nr:lipoyl synthase [Desulfovibrio ferrophilus]BBD07148.1 lipoyl synthase [Desulfovibrio ferrophilus]
MSSSKSSAKSLRIPKWLRVKLPSDPTFAQTGGLLKDLGLNTVCQGAKCPNIYECFSKHVATFLIMGRTCTRGCAFCNIGLGKVEPLDPDEPSRVAEAAKRLQLKHVVITSVTRDDLPDGGAAHFVATIQAVREAKPGCTIEVLIPDFQGDETALRAVIEAGPEIINHNVETVPDLYSHIRPQADFEQSIELLERVKAAGVISKSGLMVGLGETDDQVRVLLDSLAAAKVEIVTIGQYMRPSGAHPEVLRYVEPEIFEGYAEYGKGLGIPHVFSAPRVRSSYNAADFVE